LIEQIRKNRKIDGINDPVELLTGIKEEMKAYDITLHCMLIIGM
jgi:hypothetical protein